jgi:glycosyltransferase involved in cell wall biosynthesis
LKVLALVPARNEADSLPDVVRALVADQPGLDVLVVDDASSDATGEILPALGVEWLRLTEHLGVGSAIRAGLRYASHLGYDVVVRTDGDGQHPASEIERLLAPILSGEADAVVGSRYNGSSTRRALGFRRTAQHLAAAWLSFTTGLCVTDPTSGFWAFGPRAVRLLASRHPTGYPEPELLMLLAQTGLRVVEVPIQMNARIAGQTSLTAARVGSACVSTGLSLLISPLRRSARGVRGE